MRHGLLLIVGTLTCLIAASATGIAAETSTPPPAPTTTTDQTLPGQTSDNSAQTAEAAKGDDEIVCKKEPPPVGSRMGGRKVCKTVAEWRKTQEAAKETVDEFQRRGRAANTDGR